MAIYGVRTSVPDPKGQLTVDHIGMSAEYNEIAQVGSLSIE